MLFSMTGYGSARGTFHDKTILVELRSVNSKFTEVRLKLPVGYKSYETAIRKLVAEVIDRGKIELNLYVKSEDNTTESGINKELFKSYYTTLNSLCRELEISDQNILQSILSIPEVLSSEAAEIEEEEWLASEKVLKEAFEAFNEFRKVEGGALKKDLEERLDSIQTMLIAIEPFEVVRLDFQKNRLQKLLEEHGNGSIVDQNRFEQELIYYLEKIDINEEKVRLRQHCIYFASELNASQMNKGRKLGFIAQEIGREINTLGAKAYSADIQKLVVMMKDDLEKIKEQIANIV